MDDGTGQGGRGAAPSRWARERFGGQAAALTVRVPVRLAQAHERARAGHLATALKKRGPYGHALPEAVREELAEEARMLGGSVRELLGYAYAVVNDHALFPFRYADRPLALERARLRSDVSETRRRMLTAHGPHLPDGLFPVDDSLTSEEYERLHEVFEELGRTTKLVSVFFTSDVEHGVHAIHWGDAHLEPDRTFTWSYVEQLPSARLP